MTERSEAEPAPSVLKAARSRFSLVGGDPSVDFVNTVDSWLSDAPSDKLESYADLLDWCEQAGLAPKGLIAPLREEASRRHADAERVLRRAHALREALYRILTVITAGEPPDRKHLDVITSLARKAAAHSRLDHREEGFVWELDEAGGCKLDWPIWEVARAAVELLTSKSLRRVRQCADETCGWLFIDRSRNRSRRWCDMSSCGNRAKARRNYARRKARQLAANG